MKSQVLVQTVYLPYIFFKNCFKFLSILFTIYLIYPLKVSPSFQKKSSIFSIKNMVIKIILEDMCQFPNCLFYLTYLKLLFQNHYQYYQFIMFKFLSMWCFLAKHLICINLLVYKNYLQIAVTGLTLFMQTSRKPLIKLMVFLFIVDGSYLKYMIIFLNGYIHTLLIILKL